MDPPGSRCLQRHGPLDRQRDPAVSLGPGHRPMAAIGARPNTRAGFRCSPKQGRLNGFVLGGFRISGVLVIEIGHESIDFVWHPKSVIFGRIELLWPAPVAIPIPELHPAKPSGSILWFRCTAPQPLIVHILTYSHSPSAPPVQYDKSSSAQRWEQLNQAQRHFLTQFLRQQSGHGLQLPGAPSAASPSFAAGAAGSGGVVGVGALASPTGGFGGASGDGSMNAGQSDDPVGSGLDGNGGAGDLPGNEEGIEVS